MARPPLLDYSTDDLLAAVGTHIKNATDISYELATALGHRPAYRLFATPTELLREAGISVSRVRHQLDQLVDAGTLTRMSHLDLNRLGVNRRKGAYYLTAARLAELVAARDAMVAKSRHQGLLERAQQIVLDRHADEVDAVLAELAKDDA